MTIQEREGGPDVVLLDLAAYLTILTTCESPAFVRILGSVLPDVARQPAALAICILGLAAVLVLVRPYHVARAIVGAVKQQTGQKAKGLFHPIRVALTGKTVGLGLFEVIYYLGKERTIYRLSKFIKKE